MAYKFKPNKGIKKRVKVTSTGKLKHRHEKNSHHRSGRNSALKRRLGRPGLLDDTQGGRLRGLIGLRGSRPKQAVHERKLKAAEAAQV
jgi:large subunit ribosomal protein L35